MPTKPQVHSPFPGQPQSRDTRRGSSAARGYDYAWQRFRKWFLGRHPLCITCERENHIVPAVHVDHEPPLTGPHDPGRLDEDRCQPLCARHHNAKTRRQQLSPGSRC